LASSISTMRGKSLASGAAASSSSKFVRVPCPKNGSGLAQCKLSPLMGS
jgi:hypothetical protein